MNAHARDDPFCSNPDCLLHVRSGDAGVIETGNWAELPDGTIIGRGIYHDLYLCHLCGQAWRAVISFNLASEG